MDAGDTFADELLQRCTFPPRGTGVSCAFSGGPDSTALIVLARRAGCDVTAIHVDHGLRPSSGAEADEAQRLAATVGVAFERHRISVGPGSNLEARARAARAAVLPPGTLTGHTADDRAETMLINLLRGSGGNGLAAMAPAPTRPLAALRRAETARLCELYGLQPVQDPSNDDARFVRNRLRSELIPLLHDIARRDVVPLLTRTAELLEEDNELLDRLAGSIDPTDAAAVAAAEPVLARRCLRAWLTVDGYAPDRATLDRALDVARGLHVACELGGWRRLERSRGRLRIVEPGSASERSAH